MSQLHSLLTISESIPSDICAQRRVKSACTFAVWPQISQGAFRIAKAAKFFHAGNEDWSECVVNFIGFPLSPPFFFLSFFLLALFYCLELHMEIRRGYTWVKLVLSPSTPLPSPQCFVVLLFVLRRLLWCGSSLFVPANIQRSNNVVTTSLQRRDVAATL